MKLLVTGGNGFIGAEVCRVAVEAGHQVVGLARRGRPKTGGAWADRVEWVAADVLRPEAWRAHLAGCAAVVHCVGIIREQPARGVTFERINGDAAVTALGEAARAGVGAFVYLSASQKPPGVGEGYLTAKRRAEAAILEARPRSVVLRPGFVYGRGRLVSLPAAAAMKLGLLLPPVRARFGPSRPLAVETVARAALRAAGDAQVRGIVDADGIERLGKG